MATRVPITTYTEGDTQTLQRTHSDGTVDITGWDITFRMRRNNGTVFIRVTPVEVVITNGPLGLFEVTFAADNLVAGITQEAEIEFDDAGSIITEKLFFDIAEEIG